MSQSRISIGRAGGFTNRHQNDTDSPVGRRMDMVERMTPFEAAGDWLRCALHAHTTNSDGELAAGVPRPALRLGRLRRPRDHRSLGADGRAVHASAARDPVHRAERGRRRGGGRPRPRPRGRGRPGGRPRAASSRSPDVVDWIVANGGLPYLAHTYWSGLRTEQWGSARACSGSRCGTRAASSSSGAATPRSTGTRRSSTAGRCKRSPPTTRTTPATTAASPGRGCAPTEKTQAAVLDALRDGPVLRLDRPRDPRASRSDDEVVSSLQPGGERDALLRPLCAARGRTPAGSAIRTEPTSSSETTTA